MLLEIAHDVVNVWKVILPEDEHLHTKLDTYSLFIHSLTDVQH